MPGDDSTHDPPEGGVSRATPPDQPRRSHLTPEQRRFLNKPRAREERAQPPIAIDVEEPRPTPEAASAAVEPENAASPEPPDDSRATERDDARDSGARRTRPATSVLKPGGKEGRRSEMQRALVIICVLVFFALTFYVGLKFHYWKYLLFSARNAPKLEETRADKFPGVSSDELVAQALQAEREGKWQEAAERFIAAKHKNLQYRGILFRVGQIGYENGDFDTADKLLERAIAFGENLDSANYYRGLIAVRRKDLAGAQRFFAAAVQAAPFVADYHYYLAEALRMNHQPAEAIPRYEHGALLARNEQDAAVCRFKIRMARLEAADASKVRAEILEEQRAGALSVDWLMTAAALHLREGDLDLAISSIGEARAANQPGLFVSCTNDFYFFAAAQKHPRLSAVYEGESTPASDTPF